MVYDDITPAMTSDSQNINGRTYIASADSLSTPSVYACRAFNSTAWISAPSSFPHWWKLDMGGYLY